MDSFVEYVLDQLSGLGPVRARAMFGGHGLYCGAAFFAIIAGGRLYFKTDEATRAGYVARGMGPFMFNETQASKRYYEVPADVLEDDEALVLWAEQAVRVGE